MGGHTVGWMLRPCGCTLMPCGVATMPARARRLLQLEFYTRKKSMDRARMQLAWVNMRTYRPRRITTLRHLHPGMKVTAINDSYFLNIIS